MLRRHKLIALLTVLYLVVMIAGCTRESQVKSDTPVNAAWMVKRAIDSNNYERFNSLFLESRKEYTSKQDFESMRRLITAGAEYTSYQLIRFSNGEMLLVKLTQEKINGEYRIEDIVVVPDDMKKIFLINEKDEKR